MKPKVTFLPLLFLLHTGTLGAYWPQGLPLSPSQVKIRDAASMKDPQAREEALRKVLGETLLSQDSAVREGAFMSLSYQLRWLDPKPFEDVIMEFSKKDEGHRGAWLLDEAQFFHGSREERLTLCSSAIVNGTITMAHGRPLRRDLAMELAASQGLVELEPVVNAFYGTLGPQSSEKLPLGSLSLLFKLRGDAGTREEAVALGGKRLAEMEPGEFRQKMQTEKEFRRIALKTAEEACETNPFTQKENPGCGELRRLVDREESKARGSAEEERRLGRGAMAATEKEKWLEDLRGRVPLR